MGLGMLLSECYFILKPSGQNAGLYQYHPPQKVNSSNEKWLILFKA